MSLAQRWPAASAMTTSWFFSKTVREATAMRHHVEKHLNHQRDVLSPQAVAALESAIDDMKRAVNGGTNKGAIEQEMEKFEAAANKWLKPYPNAARREYAEMWLVALAVAMGIRTFFLQPFKIPTGSMQPTLFGVTSENLIHQPDSHVPSGLERIRQWFEGISYVHVVAENDGYLEDVQPPTRFLIFNIKQSLIVGGKTYTIWFPPDYGAPPTGTLEYRAELRPRQQYFHKGDDIVFLKVSAGDHLFVDRVTYNFRPPKRGEIIVFATKGIETLPQDQFYIKRLVALGGDNVQVGDDRHLIINGKRLDAATPHFEKVLGFNPSQPPLPNHYSGYVNEKVLHEYYPGSLIPLAPLFPDQSAVFHVEPDHYLVMGDNTMDSLDSRSWGDFPASNVIGKSFFVYWPITSRFGCGYHR